MCFHSILYIIIRCNFLDFAENARQAAAICRMRKLRCPRRRRTALERSRHTRSCPGAWSGCRRPRRGRCSRTNVKPSRWIAGAKDISLRIMMAEFDFIPGVSLPAVVPVANRLHDGREIPRGCRGIHSPSRFLPANRSSRVYTISAFLLHENDLPLTSSRIRAPQRAACPGSGLARPIPSPPIA